MRLGRRGDSNCTTFYNLFFCLLLSFRELFLTNIGLSLFIAPCSIGEAGLDAGGLTREWFQLVTEQLFDPDIGLFVQSADNQMLLDINPASKWCCPEDHLKMFRFLGRVMGKAMFDGQLVVGHMIPTLYKVFLMFPLLFPDLKDADEALFNNLGKLEDMPEDQIEYLCLDFTVVEEAMGATETVDLIPNGADTDVEADNLPEYLEANFKYRMLDRVKSQITELLLGFLDVIPECLLVPFDYQELELILCGLPHIDMEDWVANTEYTGALSGAGPDHQLIKWWWEVVETYDEEMKARLLQFVTATSGVPSRGFGYLQGNDGNIMKFVSQVLFHIVGETYNCQTTHEPAPTSPTFSSALSLSIITDHHGRGEERMLVSSITYLFQSY
jgi:hypothetical protein